MRALRIAAVLLVACAACADAGSSPPSPGAERTGESTSAIIHGTDSTPDQDAVVMIKHYDAIQIGGGAEGCTGTMLTPRLVLTARHCVAETDPQLVCESDGSASFGGNVKTSYPANKLFAFSGTARPDFLTGLDRAARGLEIIDDGAKNLCNHDLALIVLEKPLPGAKIAQIRLDAPPKAGELTTVVGWGITDKETNPPVRKQRTGVGIDVVGPADHLGSSEFRVGESSCAGDSGGPAFAPSGAVLGVVSRGGNGKPAKPEDPSAQCIGGESVFTAVAGFRDLVLAAYAKAGQDPWYEGGQDPRLAKAAAPAPAEESSGCSAAHGARGDRTWALVMIALVAIGACVSRRRTRSSVS